MDNKPFVIGAGLQGSVTRVWEKSTQAQTTAQLRTAAYDAEQAKDYRLAAELYQAALDAYPVRDPKNQLANADREGLNRRARSMRTMVVYTERLCEVAA